MGVKKYCLILIIISFLMISCESTEDSCSETDGGYDIYVKGLNTGYYNGNYFSSDDYCMNQTLYPGDLMEYTCQESNNIISNSAEIITCDNYCYDGACVEELPDGSCSETDSGLDPYVKGINIGYQPSSWGGNYFSSEDYCMNQTLYPGDLMEYTCQESNNVITNTGEIIECDNYCYDGACVDDFSNISCSDSDGGLDPYVKGTNIGYTDDGQYWGALYDYCREPAVDFPADLIEYHCDSNNYIQPELIVCDGYCYDGACVDECPLGTVEVDIQSGDNNEGHTASQICTNNGLGSSAGAIRCDGFFNDDIILEGSGPVV
jgi:hypothetical protein